MILNKYSIILIFALFSVCMARAGGRDSEKTPERDMVEFVREGMDPTGRARYVYIHNYFARGEFDNAIRAAKKLTELVPKDGKAFGLLGVMQFTAGRSEEAVPSLQSAIHLGDEKSVVVLGLALCDQGKPIDDYVDRLQAMRLVDVDAYMPLLLHAFRIESKAKRGDFVERTLRGRDLSELCVRDDIFEVLVRLYKSLDAAEKIKEIENIRMKALPDGKKEPVVSK